MLWLQDTRYMIQDVYLGTISHPEWVFFGKVPSKVLLKTHKICMYKYL